jgi:hypothetical protein
MAGLGPRQIRLMLLMPRQRVEVIECRLVSYSSYVHVDEIATK